MYDPNHLTAAELEQFALSGFLSADGHPESVSYRPELDWSGLSASVLTEARNAAERIRARHGSIIEKILETGADLLLIKDKLGHGRFGAWLDAEFGWSDRTAENYMASAREFSHKPEVAKVLRLRALYKLAARSTPQVVRDAIVAEIAKGQVPDRDEIARRVVAAREATKKAEGSSTAIPVAASGVPGAVSASSLPTEGKKSEASSPVDDSANGKATHAKDGNQDGCRIDGSDVARPQGSTRPAGPAATDLDERRKQSERADRVVSNLQRIFGAKFERFRNALTALPAEVFFEALRNPRPALVSTKGEVLDLAKDDWKSTS